MEIPMNFIPSFMLQRFLLLIASVFVFVQVHAQTCDVQIITTGVSCNGQSNGTAKVVVNGQAAGNPQGCLTADPAPASYTTGCTATYSSNTGTVEINPGQQVCISSTNFTGGIQATGGTLVITGNATPAYMNLSNSNPGFTLIVLGTAQFSSLNLFGSSTVKNYGTLNVPSVGFNGTLENNGTLVVTGDLNINSPYGSFTNKGSVTVSSNFNNFNTTLNGGTIAVSGTINNNSGGTLNNLCTITAGGEFNNNKTLINKGRITVGGKTALNGPSLYQGYAGSVLTTGSSTIDGIVQGMGSNCASIKVTGGAIVNSTAAFSGAIDYCAPNGTTNTGSFTAPATKNCSCTPVSATYAWQSPLSGTTDNITGLSAGITYSVLVSPQGCAPVTKTFTIQAPAVVSAVVTPNGLTASVAASGGTAPFSYVWSGNQSTQASASYAASGTYSVVVKDSKGCSTTQPFTLTAPTTPPAGSCVITVEIKNPTCAGASDGSATIYLNGNVLGTGTGGGTQTPAGCSAVQASTYSCSTGCTQTVSDNTAWVNVAAGQQVCLTATAYTGNINVTGGTLVICGKATPQNINYNTNGAAFTLVVNGELTLSNLNLPTNCTLKNYGKVTYTSSVSFNGRVENYGTMTAAGDFNNNASTGTFFNYGTLSVSGNLNNNVTGTNSGILNITGNLQVNGGSTFTNNCTIQVGNEFINNAAVTNTGNIQVNQWTRLNGGSTISLAAGTSLNTKHLTLDGTITGTGTTCSAVKVTGQSIVNGPGKLQGPVSLCTGAGPNTFTGTLVAPATSNCSCVLQPLQYSSPLLGMNNPYLGIPKGTYTVTVQAEGCPATEKTFTLTDPDPITATVAVSGKTATVTAGGGQGALLYTWSDGTSGSSNSHTYVNNGTYQVTVTDTKNCSKTLTFSIPVNTTTTPCCSQLNVEYITVNQVRFTSGCSAAVSVLNAAGAALGNTVTRPLQDSVVQVRTSEGCVFEILVKGSSKPPVSDPPNPLSVSGTVTPESCPGKKDGAIQLTITGGSGDYSISNNYNTLINNTGISTLGAGIVEVQVYDNKNGYYKTVPFTVGIKPANTYQLVANSYTSGGDIASVKIQVNGSVSTASTTVDWGALGGSGFGPVAVPAWLYSSAGYATATISESWGCPVTLELPVVATVCPGTYVPAVTVINATCFGGTTGSATITNLPAGASVAWSGTPYLSTGNAVNNLAAGTYRADVFLTLSNGNKCIAGTTNPVSIGQPAKIQVAISQQNSSYTAQVSGGVPAYSYQWSNGTNAATATLATGGFYQLQVTDSKSCTQATQLYIPSTPCVPGISLDITQLSCSATAGGKITASSAISGASYYWTSVAPATAITNAYTATQENLAEGLYIVSVKGWNPECLSRTGVRLKKPLAMTAVSKQIGSTVNIVVSNGTPNYTVVWRFDNKVADSRSDLTPGVSYTVDITDSKGCTLVYTFTFNPCALNPVAAGVMMVDKTATPQVSGGAAPYTYLWSVVTVGSNALATPTAAVQTNLEGLYKLTVTDSRGCTGMVQVTGPNCGMNGIAVVPAGTSCKTACDGNALLSGAVPTGAVIRWDKTALADKFINACSGDHNVQIQNAAGCYIEKNFTIPLGGAACITETTCTLSAALQTATSKLQKNCAEETAFIDIRISGGLAPFTMRWDVKLKDSTTVQSFTTDKEDFTGPLPGTYTFHITDQRGCTQTVTATVQGPARPLVTGIERIEASCPETLAAIGFSFSGGTAPYTIIELSSPLVPAGSGTKGSVSGAAFSLQPAAAGGYSYKITDVNGCSQPLSISISSVSDYAATFPGGIVASQQRLGMGQEAKLTARTVSGYTISWNGFPHPGQRVQVVSKAGVYSVTYNRTGCTAYTRSVAIDTVSPLDPVIKSALCSATEPLEIPVDTVDRCAQNKHIAAQAFAQYRYELYVAEQKRSIRNQYLKAVLVSAKESLTMNFTDQEEHYTLYYYDQSGNLVRTVPPAGVKVLSADQTAQAVNELAGTVAAGGKILTEHDYTTTYAYNSLNQLVHQDIPDHQRMDLWQTAASSITLNGGTVAAVAYNPQGNGGLLLANTSEKAQLLSTADAGKTWSNNANIGLGQITAISRVAATNIVYAGGDKGTFLRSDNGGRSWTLLPLGTQSTVKLISFTAAGTGWIITRDGNQYTSPDAGKTWQVKAQLAGSVGANNTILDAAVNKTNGNIWVLVSNGKIYQSITDGSIWTERTIESPTVNTVALNGTDVIGAGPKGTLFTGNTSLAVQRTGLDKTISKLLPLGGNTYYALTSDGLVYYSTTPLTWTQVGSISGITEITKESSLVMAYTTSGAYALSNGTLSILLSGFKRVRPLGSVYAVFNGSTFGTISAVSGTPAVTAYTTVPAVLPALKDFYIQNGKIIALSISGNVYEGTVDLSAHTITFPYTTAGSVNTATPNNYSGAVVNSFTTDGTALYLRTNTNTVLAYNGTLAVTLNGNVTDVALSSATAGYAVESGRVKKIVSGGVSATVTTLLPTAIKTITADGTKAYAAGSNGELYVSTGTTFSYVPVVSSTAAFTDAAYSAAQGKLALITAGSQLTYDEVTGTFTPEINYPGALQVSTTPTAGTVLVAAQGSPVAGQTILSVEGNSTDTYLAGADAGKIWYKESSATNYAASTINIQPLASLAYASANTVIAVGQQGTILRSADAGASWQMVYSGTINNLTQVSAQGNTAVAIGAANTVLYSSNGGLNWSTASGAITAPTSVKVAPQATLITAGTGIYKSTNSGQTFALDGALTGNSSTLRSVWLDNDGYGFAVGDAGAAYRITPATTSTFLYTKILTDATPNDDKGTGLPVAAFKTVQFSDRLTGYITGTNNVVLKTVDGGEHWKSESNGIASTGTPQLALSSDAQRGTLIGADGSVQALSDQAESFNSRFWYDELGRLVLSQNAKQFTIVNYEDQALLANTAVNTQGGVVRAYSYTLYDNIGRITEVGELLTDKLVATYKNESQVQYATHAAFAAAGYRHQVSKTKYDRNDITPAGFTPTYLRNRVAYTTYQQEQNKPVQATHYSYDVHGNVNSLLQVITHDGNVLAKTVDYEYDLISGKVNKVYYQKGKADQLIHRYAYDGDNRITKVETSTDSILFTKEASYEYYAHGPLARTKLGELNVETQNYAYTVQGWIKQMQAEAFSFALGYNEKDYNSIGTNSAAADLATPIATVSSVSKGLYNGNIASMTSKTPKMAEIINQQAILQQQYSYDQLNRITASNTPGSGNAYSTSYTYDANGNIKTLGRYDKTAKFDELSYNYETKAAGYQHTTNKLRWVDDTPGLSGINATDVDDQATDNYSYDAIGNLIRDNQEEIDTIQWTVSGKVRRVIRKGTSAKPNLEFEYDASGQRIVKKVIRKDGTATATYYLRDASGNVMSVYSYNANSDNDPALTEQYLYGSSRIGVYTPTANVLSKTRNFGRKSYELSDHLGNVRATLSDYKNGASPPQVQSAMDFYPFGMVARSYSSSEQYRYGYNSQEKVEELGEGHMTAEYWEYDARLARRWNIDPIVKFYESSYAVLGNNPIWFMDQYGADTSKAATDSGGNPTTATTQTNQSYYKLTGSKNLMIFIMDKGVPFDKTNFEKERGDWDVIAVNNLEEAQQILEMQINAGGYNMPSIENFAIRSHGSPGDLWKNYDIPYGYEQLSNPTNPTTQALKYFKDNLSNNANVVVSACNLCMSNTYPRGSPAGMAFGKFFVDKSERSFYTNYSKSSATYGYKRPRFDRWWSEDNYGGFKRYTYSAKTGKVNEGKVFYNIMLSTKNIHGNTSGSIDTKVIEGRTYIK